MGTVSIHKRDAIYKAKADVIISTSDSLAELLDLCIYKKWSAYICTTPIEYSKVLIDLQQQIKTKFIRHE